MVNPLVSGLPAEAGGELHLSSLILRELLVQQDALCAGCSSVEGLLQVCDRDVLEFLRGASEVRCRAPSSSSPKNVAARRLMLYTMSVGIGSSSPICACALTTCSAAKNSAARRPAMWRNTGSLKPQSVPISDQSTASRPNPKLRARIRETRLNPPPHAQAIAPQAQYCQCSTGKYSHINFQDLLPRQ